MENLIQKAYFSRDLIEKKEHYHDCHQIILITDGLAKFCINNKIYDISSGSIVLYSRYENHSVNILSNKYERYVLQINPKAIGVEARFFSLLLNRPKDFCNTLDVSDVLCEFENVFKNIVIEYNCQDKFANDMLQFLVGQLLVKIYRKISDTTNFEIQTSKLIFDIQQRFESDFSSTYSLDSLAKHYNISVSSLSHLFKKTTGVSVMEYLILCRIASAKSYLSESNLSIGEIVEKCGFSDNSNFSRTFKKFNGITPTEFRKKAQDT